MLDRLLISTIFPCLHAETSLFRHESEVVPEAKAPPGKGGRHCTSFRAGSATGYLFVGQMAVESGDSDSKFDDRRRKSGFYRSGRDHTGINQILPSQNDIR
jgi:hypothetical protein